MSLRSIATNNQLMPPTISRIIAICVVVQHSLPMFSIFVYGFTKRKKCDGKKLKRFDFASCAVGKMDISAETAQQLFFEKPWQVYLKRNTSEWTLSAMPKVFCITTIADFWQFYNNMSPSLVGVCNIFMMADSVLPLWEKNAELFQKGGCWSVVVRSRNSWLQAMQSVAMALVGECVFDDSRVKGVCYVPVSEGHVICKIWCTHHNDLDGKQLAHVLSDFQCSAARYKAFSS